MNKTKRRGMALGLGLASLGVSACTPAQIDNQGAVDEAEVRSLAAPEPGASAGEYQRRVVTLRLFGTQGGGSGEAAFATIAETDTWQTRDVRIGQTLGRNLVLTAVTSEGVRLRDGARSLWVPVGADLPTALIEHQYDRAVRDEGEHVYSVQPALLKRLLARYGFGGAAEQVTLADQPALRLSAVAPGGLLQRLGFAEGDLIFAVDGEAPTPAGLQPALARLLQPESGAVLVRVAHGHSQWEATYRTR